LLDSLLQEIISNFTMAKSPSTSVLLLELEDRSTRASCHQRWAGVWPAWSCVWSDGQAWNCYAMVQDQGSNWLPKSDFSELFKNGKLYLYCVYILSNFTVINHFLQKKLQFWPYFTIFDKIKALFRWKLTIFGLNWTFLEFLSARLKLNSCFCVPVKKEYQKRHLNLHIEPQKWEFCHFGAKMALLRPKMSLFRDFWVQNGGSWYSKWFVVGSNISCYFLVLEKTSRPSYRTSKVGFLPFWGQKWPFSAQKWAFLGIFEYKMVVYGISNDLLLV